MSKRIIALLLALVMVFALCACGNGGNGGNSAGTEDVGDETYTIRIACENSDSYPATLGLYQMEKYVESHTNGKVQVEVCASGQLGGEEETLEQVAQGNLEMAVASFAPVVSYVPEFEVMDIPFVYNSYTEAWMVLDSYVGTNLLDKMEAQGLKGMAYMETACARSPATSPLSTASQTSRALSCAPCRITTTWLPSPHSAQTPLP